MSNSNIISHTQRLMMLPLKSNASQLGGADVTPPLEGRSCDDREQENELQLQLITSVLCAQMELKGSKVRAQPCLWCGWMFSAMNLLAFKLSDVLVEVLIDFVLHSSC